MKADPKHWKFKTIYRCAVYTRKSTSEGADQGYTSIEAQRDSGVAFVASQRQEGWECVEKRYDDLGYSGANMERPGLRSLKEDLIGGKIDCIVVYKVDRISRSLRDFLWLMDLCQKHNVMFVSVTQAFNTTTPSGRLMLNMLLSFAEFEREMISERTRDKMAAARRRGYWLGGRPVLGYDVVDRRLVVNAPEAELVREIFRLYLKLGGLISVVQELVRRGRKGKVSTTKDGRRLGGKAFTKTSLHRLLTNVTYIGKTQYKREIYDGQHDAIVDPETWQRTQEQLARNSQRGGSAARNKSNALLKGIVWCVACGCLMTPTYATKDRQKRYRYYRCQHGQQNGRGACPSPSVPAHQIEQVVVDQIGSLGGDPTLVAETLQQARRQSELRTTELKSERRALERELSRRSADSRGLLGPATSGDVDSPAVARLADLLERIRVGEARLAEIDDQLDHLRREALDEQLAAKALSQFDPVWNALTPREQVQLIQLVVKRVDFDGVAGKVSITFHPTGLQCLVDKQEQSA